MLPSWPPTARQGLSELRRAITHIYWYNKAWYVGAVSDLRTWCRPELRQPTVDATENPYVSPKSQSASTKAAEHEVVVKGRWLVFTSVILAFFLEVWPVEADLLYSAVRTRNILAYLGTKTAILSVILLPLFIFV